jgi:hypothetical protein
MSLKRGGRGRRAQWHCLSQRESLAQSKEKRSLSLFKRKALRADDELKKRHQKIGHL